MTVDAKSLDRKAQDLVVDIRYAYDSPPVYTTRWTTLWSAKVDRVVINGSAAPSSATVWFPQERWDGQPVKHGDMIRIRTMEPKRQERTILFVGYITSYHRDYSGGTDKASAYERNTFTALDHRWLLSVTSPIYSQFLLGPDNYTDYGTSSQAVIFDSCIFASGRRTIFNADGKPNSDSSYYVNSKDANVPIFTASEDAWYWTAKDMLRYCLCMHNIRAFAYLPITNPETLLGLDHSDWDIVLYHITVEGLNLIEATDLICKNIGWGFREDYYNDGWVAFSFYKKASAYVYARGGTTIRHQLCAPALGSNIKTYIDDGEKMLWAMQHDHDISEVVNNPWGLGSIDKFELTTELVPAWLDDDMEPDISSENANLYRTDAQLQDETDPNNLTFFRYYHPRGAEFRRTIGRKWTLNESGKYSVAPRWVQGKRYAAGDISSNGSSTFKAIIPHIATIENQPASPGFWAKLLGNGYDRGAPFDFSLHVPPVYSTDYWGDKNFGAFKRQLLPALSVDPDSLNSIGIKVEFSFDGGDTWQIIPATISALGDECGIYIDEPNLAELVDVNEGSLTGEKLSGVQLNYFTSLTYDKVTPSPSDPAKTLIFKEGEWKTRVRVTASIQLDQRLARQTNPSTIAGSPFYQSRIYDFSSNKKYGIARRTASSEESGPTYDYDTTDWLDYHLTDIREANQDPTISGYFTLERLWLGDGDGEPAFMIGDAIERITGREYNFADRFGDITMLPEIIQIVYFPDKQKMKLITRDLRFSETVI